LELLTMTLEILTNSRLKAFRRCPRLEHVTYQLGYRPAVEGEALRFGTLVHKGLEAWWRGVQAGGPRLTLALQALQDAHGEGDSYELASAQMMVIGYSTVYSDHVDATYEVLGVEETFAAPLVNPETGAPSRTFELSGKFDARVREKATGRVIIVEHKTASSTVDITAGSTYRQRLQLDGQVSTYLDGSRAVGQPASAVLYDVLKKPGIRPANIPTVDDDGVKIVIDQQGQRVRTKDGKKWRETGDTAAGYHLCTRLETVDEFRTRLEVEIAGKLDQYFAQWEVVRLEADVREHAADVWQTAQTLRDYRRLQIAPRNVDGCERFGSFCSFFGPCSGQASLDDPTRFKKLDDVHPELATDAA